MSFAQGDNINVGAGSPKLSHRPSVLREGSLSVSTIPTGLEISVSAPGKLILFGEHAVVYNKIAVAAALGLRTRVKLVEIDCRSPCVDSIKVELAAMKLNHSYNFRDFTDTLLTKVIPLVKDKSCFNLSLPELIDQPVFEKQIDSAVSKFSGSYPLRVAQELAVKSLFFLFSGIFTSINLECLDLKPFHLIVETELTVSSGSGSSASYSVALAALFLQYVKTKVAKNVNISKTDFKDYKINFSDLTKFTKDELALISKWAFHAEKIIHGTPSGIDNTICTYGSMVEFKKGSSPKLLKLQGDFKILLINSNVPRNTKNMVQKVADLNKNHPKIVGGILDGIEETVKSALEIMTNICKFNSNSNSENEKLKEKYEKLLELLDINHGLLSSLGVSHEILEKIRYMCLQKGVHGKLTGAGGGGYYFCILPPYLSEYIPVNLVQTLTETGFEARIVHLGGKGVTID